jgi:hypothetical protein
MINRFSTVGQSEYTPQHVPLPFEAIAALGEKTKKEADEGAKAVEDLGALGAAIKAAPMYSENKTKFVNEYNDKSKALVEKYASDFGNPEFKRAINNLTTEFKARPEINAFANTLKSFEDWQSQKKDAKNEMNLDYTYDMDPNNSSNFRQRDVVKEGVYSPKMTQYEDWNETGKKVMGKVADSGYNKELGLDFNKPTIINNGETMVYSNKTKGWVGVSDPRVQNLSKLMVGEYANTVAGKHHLQSLVGQDIDYSQLSRMAQSGNEQAVKTKNAVDEEFKNHLYRSNANQIGGVETSKIDYMNVTDRSAEKANDAAVETNKNPWNLYAPNANPDPNNAVAKALYSANPNSAFKVGDNGEVEDIKPEDIGTKNVGIFRDRNGKIWNPTNLPAGWFYKKDSWGGDYFESTGGTKIYTANLQSDVQKINNIDIYAKQVNEVLQWAASTGQYETSKVVNGKVVKARSGSEQYKELLPKYKAAIKNGALNSQYIPQFDAESAANFKETFAPKLVTTANGTTVKDPGLVSNWTIEGISTNEEKMKILNNFNPIGLDMIKGGDNILISSEDGKEYSVNMNNPTLKSTFSNLSRFVRTNNTAKLNPTKVDSKEVMKTTGNYLTNLATNAINLATQQGLNVVDAQNEIMQAQNSYTTKANSLIKDGYIPTETYQDPTTGTLAVSYINHTTIGGQDVKVLKFHPGVDAEFEELSEAAFTKEVQQKAFGNFASNLNTKGSKTTGTFIENQKPTK